MPLRGYPQRDYVSRIAAYGIQRGEHLEVRCTDTGIAADTETTLHSQARGKEWEYRVIAVNEAGEGEASNTVMAVL